MLKALFSFPLRSLTVVVLAMALVGAAWAKPKFKILHGVPGGLFSGVTLDARGHLYGTTSGGGKQNKGTVFELSPGARGWTLKTIHDFNGYDGGGNGRVIFDAAGNLYGTSPAGGLYGGGNVFEMTPGTNGWTFRDLYDFCHEFHCPDGSAPTPVILDAAGHLYGAMAGGGAYGRGGIFRLARHGNDWRESILGSFGGRPYDSYIPYAALIFDNGGSLYGTTYYGGVNQIGTIFELQRSGTGWKEKRLRQFNGNNGAYAESPLVLDDSGSFYGTTVGGGASGNGVVFKLVRQTDGSWKETLLYQFPLVAKGKFPSSGVVFDRFGNLYGTTGTGGIGNCPDGCGVVYKLTPSANGSWLYSVLHRFDAADGSLPAGGLAIDKKGHLYGTAYSVAFEITP